MIKKMFLAILALGIFATSCDNDDDNGPTTSNLTLNLSGLEDLGSDFVYEGWLLVNATPVSIGTFTNTTSPQTFSINTEQLNSAELFGISIEPSDDTNPNISETVILLGEFVDNTAALNIGVITDFIGFASASGTFFLRTPTDEVMPGPNNMNDEYGVWFGTPGMPPTANLNLPDLTSGWTYEGWVIGDSGPLSTGRFTDFGDRDDFRGFSGTEFNQGPPIPGEDFFLNAPVGETFPLDVRGRTVLITVEPVPDNSPMPFLLMPLTAVAGMATAPATHDFNLNTASFPSGSATR